jgi:hypothetical protein
MQPAGDLISPDGIPLKSGVFFDTIHTHFFRWGEAPDEPAHEDARSTHYI